MKTWNETKEQALKSLRAAYLAEVARFAETLRPRFESGELHGYNSADEEADEDARAADHALPRPGRFVLEDLARDHFGLGADDDGERTQEAFATAFLIRAVSPGELLSEDGVPVMAEAINAITNDVLAVARARCWYSITPGEWPEAEHTAWAAAEVA